MNSKDTSRSSSATFESINLESSNDNPLSPFVSKIRSIPNSFLIVSMGGCLGLLIGGFLGYLISHEEYPTSLSIGVGCLIGAISGVLLALGLSLMRYHTGGLPIMSLASLRILESERETSNIPNDDEKFPLNRKF